MTFVWKDTNQLISNTLSERNQSDSSHLLPSLSRSFMFLLGFFTFISFVAKDAIEKEKYKTRQVRENDRKRKKEKWRERMGMKQKLKRLIMFVHFFLLFPLNSFFRWYFLPFLCSHFSWMSVPYPRHSQNYSFHLYVSVHCWSCGTEAPTDGWGKVWKIKLKYYQTFYCEFDIIIYETI